MSVQTFGEVLDINADDRRRFEAANIQSAGPRSVQLHSKVRCNDCNKVYLTYWIGNRFPMRQEDSSNCECGARLIRWNDTSDLSIFSL